MPIAYSTEVKQTFTVLSSTHQVTLFEAVEAVDLYLWVTHPTAGKREPVLNAGSNGFTVDWPLSTRHPRITLTEALTAGESLIVWRLTRPEQTYAPTGALYVTDTQIFDRLDRVACAMQEMYTYDSANTLFLDSSTTRGDDTIVGGTVGVVGGEERKDLANNWNSQLIDILGCWYLECTSDGANAYLDVDVQLRVGAAGLATDPLARVSSHAQCRVPLMPAGVVTRIPLHFYFTWNAAISGVRYAMTLDNQSPNHAGAGFLDVKVLQSSSHQIHRRGWEGFA